MFADAFAEAIKAEFYNMLNIVDPSTPFREVVHNDIMEKYGLLQKSADESENEVDNRDELAQHHLEDEQEKRKEDMQSLMMSSFESSEGGRRVPPLKQVAYALISDSGNWLEEED